MCVCRALFLIKKPFLPFILLSRLSTEFHITGGKSYSKKHSSPRLIHWAAAANVQKGGKDNSQRKLPGKLLITSSLHLCSLLRFMNKSSVKICPMAKQHFMFHAWNATLTVNSRVMMDFLLASLSELAQFMTRVSWRPVSSKSAFVSESHLTT